MEKRDELVELVEKIIVEEPFEAHGIPWRPDLSASILPAARPPELSDDCAKRVMIKVWNADQDKVDKPQKFRVTQQGALLMGVRQGRSYKHW